MMVSLHLSNEVTTRQVQNLALGWKAVTFVRLWLETRYCGCGYKLVILWFYIRKNEV